MAFNIEFQDKDGNIIDYRRLNAEVCALWGVECDDKKWATPPGKNEDDNWQEFLGLAVLLTRAFRETGTFNPCELLQGLCNFGTEWQPSPENIENNRYEILLLHFWIRQGYKITVTNQW